MQISGSKTAKTTASRRRLTAACPAIPCYCNCSQSHSFAPPSLISGKQRVFEHSTLRFEDGFARRRPAGEKEGAGSSNWGVIEVTKRGEVNIPGIPSCCRPGRRTRLLPYLPWVRPASLSSFCSTEKCNYFIHWIDHVIVHLKICFDDCYHICEKLVRWSPPFDLPWFWRQSHHTTNCQPTLTNCWVSRRKFIYKVN